MALCTASVAIGAWLSVIPFLLEYRATVAQAEVDQLKSTVEQIQNLEAVADQITNASGEGRLVQEQTAKALNAAAALSERMTAEAKAFSEFLQKANDNERSHLRLEVEKLRRAEGEWLQIIVRILDHVYALFSAAVRSGQPGLIEQLGHFQNACRDVARRVGLVPFAGQPEEPFDPQVHLLPDSHPEPGVAPRINEIIAIGYTYQGNLLRKALVTLRAEPETPQISPSTVMAGLET